MKELKKISQRKLNRILKLHKKWINNEQGGKQADLSYYDFSNKDLSYRDLRCANLENTNFTGADLSGANLSYTILRFADLIGADLRSANFNYSDLTDADLTDANLTNADLNSADLRGSDLSNANLTNADLTGANLEKTILPPSEECRKGIIITQKTKGYKKYRNKIIELELPVGAVVFSINNYICRTNVAKVISIDGDKTKGMQVASYYDGSFIYEVGKTAIAKDFNTMYNVECGGGIHFFYDKEKAVNYIKRVV